MAKQAHDTELEKIMFWKPEEVVLWYKLKDNGIIVKIEPVGTYSNQGHRLVLCENGKVVHASKDVIKGLQRGDVKSAYIKCKEIEEKILEFCKKKYKDILHI
mgnify:CR=1 FL=1